MSYTNGTPFLNLPQTIGSDHRDWFDTNEAFLNMDEKFKTIWDNSGSAASAIDALQELTATLQTDLSTLEGTVNTHTSALSTINEALVLINGTLSTLNTSVATKFDSAGIADPYDAEHGIYAVGDVVTYNGQRYVCSTAVTAAEPFDADKWTAEDVQTVINDIKLALTGEVILELTPNSAETRTQILTRLADALASYSQAAKTKFRVVEGSVGSESVNVYDIYRIGTTGNFGMKCMSETGGTYDWARTTASGTSSTSIEYYYDTNTQQYVVNDVSSAAASKLTVVR